MARNLFGGSAADVAENIDGSRVPAATGTVWDGPTDTAAQITDLQDASGNPITTLTANDQGMVNHFYGPDGVDLLYVDFGAGRVALTPVNTAGRVSQHLVDVDPHGTKSSVLAEINAQRGIAGGFATLDSSGKISISQLPQDVLNVKSYGAAGDGATDDYEALQDAIDAASAAGGGALYLPQGRYLVSKALVWASGVSLIGDGERLSILQVTDPDQDCIAGTDVHSVTIEKVQLSGPGRGTGTGIRFTRHEAPALSGITVRETLVQSFGGDGIYCHSLAASTLQRVQARTCGGFGFHIENPQETVFGSASTSLISCTSHACVLGGFWLEGLSYSAVTACGVLESPTGFRLNSCTGVNLTSCGAEQCTTGLIVYGGTSSTVSGFVTKSSDGTSVKVDGGASGIVLSGVVEVSPATTATACLKTTSGTAVTVLGLTAVKPNSLSGTVHSIETL